MKIIELELKNFKQYKTLNLKFPEGLIGIVGSNGSGKSTLFDAIRCALFGEIPFNKEHLRFASAEKNETVSVALIFECSGKRYKVIREFRGIQLNPHAKLYEDNSKESSVSQQNPVTTKIEQILGMNRDAFIHSVFSGQKDLGRISETKGSERRSLVREMLGMFKIDEVQVLVRSDFNLLNTELKIHEKLIKTNDEVKDLNDKRNSLLKAESKLSEKISDIEIRMKKASDKYSESDAVFVKQEIKYKEYNKYKTEVEKYRKSAEILIKDKLESEKERDDLIKETEFIKVNDKIQDIYDLHKKIVEMMINKKNLFIKKEELEKNLKSKRESYSEIVKQLNFLETEKEEYNSKLKNFSLLESEKNDIESKILIANKETESLAIKEGEVKAKCAERRDSMTKLLVAGKNADCPLCQRPLIELYDSVMKKFNDEIADYEKKDLSEILELKEKNAIEKNELIKHAENISAKIAESLKLKGTYMEAEKRHNMLNTMLVRVKDEGELIKKEISDIGELDYNAADHIKAEKDLKKYSDLNNEFIRIKTRVSRIPEIENKILGLGEKISLVVESEKQQQEEMSKCGYSEKEYSESIKERQKAFDEKEEVQKIKDILVYEKHNIEKEINKLDIEIKADKENRDKIADLVLQKDKLNRLISIFEGFKNAVLSKVQPLLSKEAGDLFSQMTSGRYDEIYVDEDFDFFVNDGGYRFPLKRFSGGETDLANLCLRISISRILRSISGSASSGFLGFDEIFGSQDSERRSMVMDALHRLSDEYTQIFIVSHVDDVKDGFPNIIEVNKSGNMSTAVVL